MFRIVLGISEAGIVLGFIYRSISFPDNSSLSSLCDRNVNMELKFLHGVLVPKSPVVMPYFLPLTLISIELTFMTA